MSDGRGLHRYAVGTQKRFRREIEEDRKKTRKITNEGDTAQSANLQC